MLLVHVTTTIIILAIALLAAVIALTAIYMRLTDTRRRLSETIAASDRNQALARQKAEEAQNAQRQSIELSARLDSTQQQLNALTRRYEADDERFRRMSAQVLQMQSGMYEERSGKLISDMLSPLREDIKRFNDQINQCYSNEARERFALKEAVAALVDQSQTIGREARDLTNALRGNSKTQGDWGEMILLSLLEKSGLREGEEFVVQQTRDADGKLLRNDEGGMLRPDVVVYLPDSRAIVIDSKVSLSAFTEWVNADDSTPEGREAREAAGRRHVESVRKHINELYTKQYQDRIGGRSLDFVMMFVPNEAAYMAAMSLSADLWQEAYDKRVLIVSPTHLISVLRLTSQLWSHERQTANALKIAQDAGRMYDKFVGFIDDMQRIDRGIRQTSAAWTDAMKKLSTGTGCLVNRAESLRQLGIKATKRISPDLAEEAQTPEITE